jgi:hypothetical protein
MMLCIVGNANSTSLKVGNVRYGKQNVRGLMIFAVTANERTVTPMSDILTRHFKAVAKNNSAAIINIVKGELMDEINNTVVGLSVQRGQRIYLIRFYWSKKENKSVRRVCTTHFISYLIYPESPARILYNITADSSWHEIDNLYFDLKTARDALERGKGNEL